MKLTLASALLLCFSSIFAAPVEDLDLNKRTPGNGKGKGRDPPLVPLSIHQGGKSGGNGPGAKGTYGRDSDSERYILELREAGKSVPSRRQFQPKLSGSPEPGDTGIRYIPSERRRGSSSDGSLVEGYYGDE